MGEAVVEWRPGVRTRLVASAGSGSTQLCLFEQWCDPGAGAPTHMHLEVEEAVTVVDGEAEFWIEDVSSMLTSGTTVVVPPHAWHGFRNVGPSVLHTVAFFPVPSPPVCYADDPATVYEIGAVREQMLDQHRAIRPV